MSEWSLVGEIVLLQIQRRQLTDAESYTPEHICAVERMRLADDGALGYHDGDWLVDRHHRQHPACSAHWNERRAFSVGFTSHYEHMWEAFRTTDLGSAGENVIVTSGAMIEPSDIGGGVRIETVSGSVELGPAMIAQPCVQFTRYMTRRPDLDATAIAPYRDQLRRGVRGFVMPLTGAGGVEISSGDKVWIRS